MKKISTAHILLLLVVISQYLLSAVLQMARIGLSVPQSVILSQATIILPVLIYCIWKKENLFELIRFRKIKFSTVILTVFVGIMSYPVVVFLNLVSMLFVENVMMDVMPDVLSMGLGAGLVLMAFLPAVVEETVFRGVIYNSYSKRKPLLGVFLSALLFGLMHMNFNQLPYAFYLGIIMALLMEACDSILAPMILHFTMNGASTLLSFAATETTSAITEAMDMKTMLVEAYRESMVSMGMEIAEEQLAAMEPQIILMVVGAYAVIALIALAIVLTLVYAVFRSNGRTPERIFKADHSDTAYLLGKDEKMHKNRMIDIWVIVFIIYALINCVLSIGL